MHHHNGLEIKQSWCALSADFQQPIIKNDNFIYDYVTVSKYLCSLKKRETMYKMCCNSYTMHPQIKAESLHLKHIMIVSFQGQCGGVQSQNAENCVNVAVNMDPTVHNKQS